MSYSATLPQAGSTLPEWRTG